MKKSFSINGSKANLNTNNEKRVTRCKQNARLNKNNC